MKNTPTSQNGLRPMVSVSPNFSGRPSGALPYAPYSIHSFRKHRKVGEFAVSLSRTAETRKCKGNNGNYSPVNIDITKTQYSDRYLIIDPSTTLTFCCSISEILFTVGEELNLLRSDPLLIIGSVTIKLNSEFEHTKSINSLVP